MLSMAHAAPRRKGWAGRLQGPRRWPKLGGYSLTALRRRQNVVGEDPAGICARWLALGPRLPLKGPPLRGVSLPRPSALGAPRHPS